MNKRQVILHTIPPERSFQVQLKRALKCWMGHLRKCKRTALVISLRPAQAWNPRCRQTMTMNLAAIPFLALVLTSPHVQRSGDGAWAWIIDVQRGLPELLSSTSFALRNQSTCNLHRRSVLYLHLRRILDARLGLRKFVFPTFLEFQIKSMV